MKSAASTSKQPKPQPGDLDRIQVDKEFAALIPPLAKDELAQLEQSLLNDGCRDSLVVWTGKNILLDGYNRLPICRKRTIPFQVIFRELSDREAAKEFIVKNQLGKRNLSPEAASYFRGIRYLAEKQGHGGDRSMNRASYQSDNLKTSQRLAKECNVSEATILRDGKFAKCVDSIVENCGHEARPAVLAHDTGLTRFAVQRIAAMKPERQRKLIQELIETGRLPRRKAIKKRTLTLPRDLPSLGKELIHKLGSADSSRLLRIVAKLLKADQGKP